MSSAGRCWCRRRRSRTTISRSGSFAGISVVAGAVQERDSSRREDDERRVSGDIRGGPWLYWRSHLPRPQPTHRKETEMKPKEFSMTLTKNKQLDNPTNECPHCTMPLGIEESKIVYQWNRCEQCNVELVRRDKETPSKYKSRRFCSRKCSSASCRVPAQPANCKYCFELLVLRDGEPMSQFKVRRVCSASCPESPRWKKQK